jgi:CheY-like chemotaxis protein
MDAETLAKIFEPFFTTKFTGRGLGLAAVLGIVRSHGGALKVQSRRGRGTTFTIVFPALAREQGGAPKRQPAAETRERAGAAPAGSGGTILVIDDEEGVRKIAARMLQHLGFEALTAPDGRTGVELFRAEAGMVAAVLLDLTMPRMSGEQTFRALQQIKPDAPIVLMTGYTEAEAARRFEGLSPAGFIQKPFTLKELRERVQQALELTSQNFRI